MNNQFPMKKYNKWGEEGNTKASCADNNGSGESSQGNTYETLKKQTNKIVCNN